MNRKGRTKWGETSAPLANKGCKIFNTGASERETVFSKSERQGAKQKQKQQGRKNYQNCNTFQAASLETAAAAAACNLQLATPLGPAPERVLPHLRVPRAMRDLGTKMAELKFEAPLAKFEETDEWGGCDFISNQNVLNDTLNLNLNSNRNLKDAGNAKQQQQDKLRLLEDAVRDAHISKNGVTAAGTTSPNCNTHNLTELGLNDATAAGFAGMADGLDKRGGGGVGVGDHVDNFTETFGGSLEDLVNTFDEKITKCFGNYEENVEELAPVQVRSQEEIMNECQ